VHQAYSAKKNTQYATQYALLGKKTTPNFIKILEFFRNFSGFLPTKVVKLLKLTDFRPRGVFPGDEQRFFHNCI